jgi:putative tryptophan/tyrosine transport system substrate-binding protein
MQFDQLKRRDFITLLGGSAAAWPFAARAEQAAKIPRVGVLWHAGNEQEEAAFLNPLRQCFSELGYVEGKNLILENRFAAEQYDRFGVLATELVEAHVDVIVATVLPAALAAQRATSTIPIVFFALPDPVGSGLVDSLSHPGRNLTGLAMFPVQLSGKRLELLKEAVPRLSQVALLSNPTYQATKSLLNDHRAAARSLGLLVQEVEASTADAIEPAIASVAKGSGLVVLGDPMLFKERKRVAELALGHGLPSICWAAEMTAAGLLMSYGASIQVQLRGAVTYVDRILKGQKPADLPVEQPAIFELVINVRTAKALGLTIPSALLVQVDRTFE